MRTMIDLDDDLLERARRSLGTTTKKDTIHEALRRVAEQDDFVRKVDELMSIERDWSWLPDDKAQPPAEGAA